MSSLFGKPKMPAIQPLPPPAAPPTIPPPTLPTQPQLGAPPAVGDARTERKRRDTLKQALAARSPLTTSYSRFQSGGQTMLGG